ncbi:MAG TPA: M90 family metallopeptidase [Gemmatimonadales bacterium]|nr:M90 family metallopeptidase [Gemmatimonadales bacterium]
MSDLLEWFLAMAVVGALVGIAIVVTRAVLPLVRARGSIRLRTEPIPDSWRDIVARNVPVAKGLSDPERERLLRLVQVFVHDKPFEGCGGLEITEEMRVTIAAHACLLLLHLDGPCYPTVRRILVYPSAFQPKHVLPSRYMGVVTGPVVESGEAWRGGVVVLSWDNVQRGGANPTDGDDVVVHEFAHALDQEDGDAGGTPVLDSPSLVKSWARVLSARYEQLQRDVDAGHSTVLNPYGATNPAEFFAVATETFFEKPEQLKAAEPDLYDELRQFYRQDPAGRGPRPGPT